MGIFQSLRTDVHLLVLGVCCILQEFHPHLLLEAVQGDAGCNIRQSEALPNQEDLNRCVGEQRKVPRIG